MKSLCITMGPDWEQAQAEFSKVGLSVERFDAIVEDNRVLAFNKSVYACMKLAEGESLLLFEDDVILEDSPNRYYSANYSIAPVDFLTVHLGGNILGFDNTNWQMPTYHSPHLAKLHNCYQSHATLYSAECVKYILDNFKYVTDEYKTEGCVIFDEWLRTNVLNQGRSYVMKPMIAYQRPRISAIWQVRDAKGELVKSDYTYCHIKGNEWLKKNL